MRAGRARRGGPAQCTAAAGRAERAVQSNYLTYSLHRLAEFSASQDAFDRPSFELRLTNIEVQSIYNFLRGLSSNHCAIVPLMRFTVIVTHADGKEEGGSAAHLAFGPDASLVTLDHALR